MSYLKRIPAVSTLALIAGTGAAMADLTAEQAWAAMSEMSKVYGSNFTSTLERNGDTVTVKDISLQVDEPEMRVTVTYGDLALIERDGGVDVVMGPDYPVSLDFDPEGDESFGATLILNAEAMTNRMTGSPEDLVYEYTAQNLTAVADTVRIDNLTVGGLLDLKMAIATMDGSYGIKGSDVQEVASNLNMTGFDFDLAVNIPESEGGGKVIAKIEMATMTQDGVTTAPKDVLARMGAQADFGAALRDGYVIKGMFGFTGLEYLFDIDADGDAFYSDGGIATGDFAIDASADRVDVDFGQTGLDVVARGSDIPLPEVAFALAENRTRINLPLAQTDTAEDVSMLVAFKGLTLSDMIWGLFDPAGQLSRDPANVVLDVSGALKWLVDVTTLAEGSQLAGPPAEVDNLTINALELTAGGASLTGTGAFTFDNSDWMTFPGMPAPDGSANLVLTGGNTLLDKLVAMGLVPEEQAMGVRMMTGIFTRPGDGDDTLVSDIVVTKDGQVSANGQRLK